jgi:hypothetical protein
MELSGTMQAFISTRQICTHRSRPMHIVKGWIELRLIKFCPYNLRFLFISLVLTIVAFLLSHMSLLIFLVLSNMHLILTFLSIECILYLN